MPKAYLKFTKCQKCKRTALLVCVGHLLMDLEGEERCCLMKSPGLSVWKRVKGLLSSLRLLSNDWLVSACPWVVMF